ncbi:uncharacterized protein AB675_4691 [Cyphellophora attinorum]|uniref:Uncharacterized protein n=1 Tax=Cyphellophora attinorum TaxID=1664694 RepID=A0A0N0NLB1_9EURO|nr:uncharacterized protein AB675_4691 [Phialophora attinorum]KPI38978.1 hypothetical protein AB675_4691 [Phialophora attinorum]
MSSGGPPAKRQRVKSDAEVDRGSAQPAKKFKIGDNVYLDCVPEHSKKIAVTITETLLDDKGWSYTVDGADITGPGTRIVIPEKSIYRVSFPAETSFNIPWADTPRDGGGEMEESHMQVEDWKLVGGRVVYDVYVGHCFMTSEFDRKMTVPLKHLGDIPAQLIGVRMIATDPDQLGKCQLKWDFGTVEIPEEALAKLQK